MFMLCLAIAGYWEELAALAGGILTAAMQQQDFRLQLISMQNIAQTNLKYLLIAFQIKRDRIVYSLRIL